MLFTANTFVLSLAGGTLFAKSILIKHYGAESLSRRSFIYGNGYISLRIYILRAWKSIYIWSVLYFFVSKKDGCPNWARAWVHPALCQVAIQLAAHLSLFCGQKLVLLQLWLLAPGINQIYITCEMCIWWKDRVTKYICKLFKLGSNQWVMHAQNRWGN